MKLINAGRPASELRPAPVFPSSSHRTTIQPPRVPPKTGNWKLATQNTSALIFAPRPERRRCYPSSAKPSSFSSEYPANQPDGQSSNKQSAVSNQPPATGTEPQS